jgi:hypothetical protein
VAPTPHKGASNPPRRTRWIKLALVPLALLIALVLAEVVLRLRAPHDAETALREIESSVAKMLPTRTQGQKPEDTLDESGQGPALHPYFGYDWAAHNAEVGRDLAYFQGEESRRAYDVLLVGGSVAGSFGYTGAPVLAERLAAHGRLAGRPVRVLTYGRGGWKQPQPLLFVTYLLALGFQPDAVLELDGFNDCALANANVAAGVHWAHPSASHWSHLASDKQSDPLALDLLAQMREKQARGGEWLARARCYHLTRSVLLTRLIGARLRALRREYVAAAARYVKHVTDSPGGNAAGPPLPADRAATREGLVATWFESSRTLDALCRARGIRYVHVLQPTLHDAGSKPLSAEEQSNGACSAEWIEGVRFGYPRFRELGAKLSELGVAFRDGSQVFRAESESLYYDPCHFSPRGNEILAEFIAGSFLD